MQHRTAVPSVATTVLDYEIDDDVLDDEKRPLSPASSAPKPSASPPRKSGGASGLGGAKTGRGNSTKNNVAPPKNKTAAPPRKKAGRWIEFKPGAVRKDGTRSYYPKWRGWRPGNKKKTWYGPVKDLDPMTEQEKNNYVKHSRAAKKRRKQRKNGRNG